MGKIQAVMLHEKATVLSNTLAIASEKTVNVGKVELNTKTYHKKGFIDISGEEKDIVAVEYSVIQLYKNSVDNNGT
jgi:hypothetical protein